MRSVDSDTVSFKGDKKTSGIGSMKSAGDFLRRRKATVAAAVSGVAVGALFLGSTTVASWNDQLVVPGGQVVTSGNLDIEKMGVTWEDTTFSTPTSIANIATHRLVPDTSIRMTMPLDVALQGNNMLGTFQLKSGGSLGSLLSSQYVSAKYRVVDLKDNSEMVMPTSVSQSSALVNLVPANYTPQVDSNADLRVVVDIDFSKDTPGTVLTQVQDQLPSLTAQLTQVRAVAKGGLTVACLLLS